MSSAHISRSPRNSSRQKPYSSGEGIQHGVDKVPFVLGRHWDIELQVIQIHLADARGVDNALHIDRFGQRGGRALVRVVKTLVAFDDIQSRDHGGVGDEGSQNE